MANPVTAPVTLVRNQVSAPVTLATNEVTAPVGQAFSAYQLAVLQGFVGTMAEWLGSLSEARECRHDYAGGYSVCGVAAHLSHEDDAVWKISYISALTGTTDSVVENVKWDDRLTYLPA